MMVVWLKAIHISALILWCGGLLALPGLFAMRHRVAQGAPLQDLHRLTRALYINVTSPAAFVAVVAGIALIFAANVLTPWMALKLLFVGLLVILHMIAGHIVLTVFGKDGRFSRWRQVLMTSATAGAVGLILWIVLAKPQVDLALLPEVMHRPGGLPAGLQSLLDTIRPMP